MGRDIGWLGFFFYILGGFLPLVSIDIFGVSIGTPSPLGLIMHFFTYGGNVAKIGLSHEIMILAFGLSVLYPVTVVVSLYGLTYRRRRIVRYSGFMALMSSILAYMIVYSMASFRGLTLWGSAYGVYALIIGSILLIVSAQK